MSSGFAIGQRVRVIDTPREGRVPIDPRWVGVEGVVIPELPWTRGMIWIEFDPQRGPGCSLTYNKQPFFAEELQAIEARADDDSILKGTLSLADITRDEAATILSWALTAWADHNITTALQSFSDPDEIAALLARAAKAYFADSPKAPASGCLCECGRPVHLCTFTDTGTHGDA